MEYVKKKIARKLNTMGCCFFCLRVDHFRHTGDETFSFPCSEKQTHSKLFSMCYILRHLKISNNSLDESASDSFTDYNGKLIKVHLCDTCEQMNSRVSILCQQWEKIEMELSYMIEWIHLRIANSAKDSNLVQNYSKRMTSDNDSLSQLAFVDKLRKELVKKCLQRRNGHLPVVRLNRMTNEKESTAIVKEETTDAFENSDDVFRVPSPSASLDIHPSSLPSPTEAKVIFRQKLTFDAIKQPNLDVELNDVKHNPNAVKQISETLNKKRRKMLHLHYSRDTVTGTLHCKYCDRKYSNTDSFRKHYLSVHLKIRYKCETCNKIFIKMKSLKDHKKKCGQSMKTGLREGQISTFEFVCKICNRFFQTKQKLYDHSRWSHQNNIRHSCDICSKKYSSLSNLKLHKASLHFGNKFFCKFCGSQFTFKVAKGRHEKSCPQRNEVKLEKDLVNT